MKRQRLCFPDVLRTPSRGNPETDHAEAYPTAPPLGSTHAQSRSWHGVQLSPLAQLAKISGVPFHARFASLVEGHLQSPGTSAPESGKPRLTFCLILHSLVGIEPPAVPAIQTRRTSTSHLRRVQYTPQAHKHHTSTIHTNVDHGIHRSVVPGTKKVVGSSIENGFQSERCSELVPIARTLFRGDQARLLTSEASRYSLTFLPARTSTTTTVFASVIPASHFPSDENTNRPFGKSSYMKRPWPRAGSYRTRRPFSAIASVLSQVENAIFVISDLDLNGLNSFLRIPLFEFQKTTSSGEAVARMRSSNENETKRASPLVTELCVD